MRTSGKFFSMKIFFPGLPVGRLPILVFALVLFFPLRCLGQYSIGGRVVDQDSGEPLAFVNLVIDGSRQGDITDIDGIFRISYSKPIERLLLSYVGYETKIADVPPGVQELIIEMQRQAIQLAPVEVFPGENPAHRIIANAISNRQRNNPENLPSFSYTSYNKFTFTGEFLDQGELPAPAAIDSVTSRLSRHLENHDLMIMETIKQRRFRYPGLNNEIVLASRISGMENPVLALVASQFQSFSFYSDYISISGNRYLSPLAPGSLNRYFYLLEDTTFTANDTTFIISYRPSRGRNFQGLQGVLYINSNGWAIQNVIAAPYPPDEDTPIRIQQKYELIGNQHWFPTQLHSDVEFFGIREPANFKVLGIGRSYIGNIRLDTLIARRHFTGYTIDFSPQSILRDETFWNQYRNEPLTQREKNTYQRLDSIGRGRNLDAGLQRLEALLEGHWRKGIFDIDIFELISRNETEGFRPGFGLKTNSQLSRSFGLHGHIGYGLRDDMFKYGIGGRMMVYRPWDLNMGLHYQYDRQEKGSTILAGTIGVMDPQSLRNWFLRDLDMVEQQQFWLSWRMYRNKLWFRLLGQKEERQIEHDYLFVPDAESQAYSGRFNTFETGLMVRLAPGQMYVRTPQRLLSFGTDFPQYFLTITRGWNDLGGGDFNYLRAEIQAIYNTRLRMLGTQRWVLQAGLATGDVPWHKLFNAPAAYRRFSISVPQAFLTMRMDEFFSHQYAAMFFTHNFGSLLLRNPNFSPKLMLMTNMAIGNLSSSQQHQNVSLNSFPKGYFESGFALLELLGTGLTGIGLEFMYRYGPYGFPGFGENFTVRLSYSFLVR